MVPHKIIILLISVSVTNFTHHRFMSSQSRVFKQFLLLGDRIDFPTMNPLKGWPTIRIESKVHLNGSQIFTYDEGDIRIQGSEE
jgi:hypothetical protein